MSGLYREPLLPVTVSDLPSSRAVSIERYRDDTRDWRKLASKDIRYHFAVIHERFRKLQADIQNTHKRMYPVLEREPRALPEHEGFLAAIAVGTLQACQESGCWSPSYDDPGAVEIESVRAPSSRFFPTSLEFPPLVEHPDRPGPPQLTVLGDTSPLDACKQVFCTNPCQKVLLARFSAVGHPSGCRFSLTDHRGEAQVMLRTTYLQALQEMPRHLHGDAAAALQAGALIYTSDVTLLRGPLEEGAEWLATPPLLDVAWLGLQRTPRVDDQGQYARIAEKATVAETVDRLFACAAASGADVLVLPPLGVAGAGGCWHPAADAGDLLRKAVLAHRGGVRAVWVCQEYPDQMPAEVWTTFSNALTRGREPLLHRELVPLLASPWLRPGWTTKAAKLAARAPRSRPPVASGSAGRAMAA